MTPRDVFVFAVGRTPFGRFQGALAEYSPAELGAGAVDALLARCAVSPEAISHAVVGTAMLGGGGVTVARQLILRSTLPQSTPSLGVDRACCSGMSAIAIGAGQVALGTADLVLAGGVEVLSRTPRLLGRAASRLGELVVEEPLLLQAPTGGTIAGYTAEEALKAGVGREEQDAWAVQSHERYARAEQRGFFGFERFPVAARPIGGGKPNEMLSRDEAPRLDCTRAALATLPTVRGSATITAGNAPGLNDGAAFVLLGSAEAGRANGLAPLARLAGTIAVAEGPTSGTRTPAIAIRALADRLHVKLDDLAVIEINEAFAATALVSTLVLADCNAPQAERLRGKTNPNGGAVAIGHPMGASGARILMTAIGELRRQGGGIGVAAICGGFGQGEAIMVEV